MQRVVASKQLEFTWRNSEQLQGDLIDAVTALKNEPGDSAIGMSGSVSVGRQLLAAGPLDELHLLVHPIAVRRGMRLFDEGEAPVLLKLMSSKTTRCAGCAPVCAPAATTREARVGRGGSKAPERIAAPRSIALISNWIS